MIPCSPFCKTIGGELMVYKVWSASSFTLLSWLSTTSKGLPRQMEFAQRSWKAMCSSKVTFCWGKKTAVKYLNGRDISKTSFPFVWWTILQSLTQWGKVLCAINAAQDILISMLLIKNVDWVLSFLNYPGTGNSICLRINHLLACLLSVQKPRG